MARAWRQKGALWELAAAGPARPSARGVIEFIGGSYLAATPQLSYRRLLEAMATAGWAVRAWSYVPGFDHQSQANEAWRTFREARRGETTALPILRLGHSLGCKLHLLAPDGGRSCSGLVALSFNNFSAERSIPLLAELGGQLGFCSEFSPSPEQTLHQVGHHYGQARNLLVRFSRDELDQSRRLLSVLQRRPGDHSHLLERSGDHLTPVSAGWRQAVVGTWPGDAERRERIEGLASEIDYWAISEPC